MRGNPVLFDSFTGGLNSAAEPYEVKPNEARDLLNVVGTERGGVRKRNGTTSAVTSGTLTSTVDGVFATRSLGGFIVSGAGKLQRITAGGVVSDLKTGLTAGKLWDYAEAAAVAGKGPVYMVNGTDTPQQWDGVAASTTNWAASAHSDGETPTLSNVPNGQFMAVWENRLWIAAPLNDPSALFWSEIGQPSVFPVANITRFDPNDRGAITGIQVCGPYLLVFKSGKIFTVFDSDTSANRPLTDNLGTLAHRSLIDTPSGCMFLANDGIYVTDGNSSIKKLSDKVQPTLDAIPPQLRHLAAGAYRNHNYFLSFAAAGGHPDRTLVYDFEQGSWWLHSLGGYQWTVQDIGNGEELFCVNGTQLVRTQVDGELRDMGAAFPGFWSSAFHHFGQPALRKHVRQIHFDGYGWIDLYTAHDFMPARELVATQALGVADTGDWEGDPSGYWEVEDGGVYGGSGFVHELIVYTLGVGRSWGLTVGNAVAATFEIDSYTISLTWRRD